MGAADGAMNATVFTIPYVAIFEPDEVRVDAECNVYMISDGTRIGLLKGWSGKYPRVLVCDQKLREWTNAFIEGRAMWARTWDGDYSDRERALIKNCELYAANEPAGLPGHRLMLIIARMAADMDQMEREYVNP